VFVSSIAEVAGVSPPHLDAVSSVPTSSKVVEKRSPPRTIHLRGSSSVLGIKMEHRLFTGYNTAGPPNGNKPPMLGALAAILRLNVPQPINGAKNA
jgi:hypothetical protein